MRTSSRLKSSSRSELEETRWLQPAQAERGVQRPWNRSNISAPIPHRPSRSKRMDLIAPLAIEPETSRSVEPISNSFSWKCKFEKNVPQNGIIILDRRGALQADREKKTSATKRAGEPP